MSTYHIPVTVLSYRYYTSQMRTLPPIQWGSFCYYPTVQMNKLREGQAEWLVWPDVSQLTYDELWVCPPDSHFWPLSIPLESRSSPHPTSSVWGLRTEDHTASRACLPSSWTAATGPWLPAVPDSQARWARGELSPGGLEPEQEPRWRYMVQCPRYAVLVEEHHGGLQGQ